MSKNAMQMALDALELNTTIEGGYCSCCGHQPCLKTCSVIQAIDALRAALDAPEPEIGRTIDQFLCNGTRFKIAFFDDGDDEEYGGDIHVKCFNNFMSELDGRWVALVPAENDCHLKRTEYVLLSDARIISLAYDCNAMPESCTDESLKLFARAIEQEVRGK